MSKTNTKVKITDSPEIITVANGLSILRAFLAYPIIYFLAQDKLVVSIIIILFAVVSDFLDGLFARRANEITNLGKILDPVADKIVIFAVLLFLVLDEKRDFPGWFLTMYVIRDLTISISSLYIMNHFSVTLSANKVGKVSITISAIAIFLYVLNVSEIQSIWKYYPQLCYYVLLVATLLVVISWYQYAKKNLSFFLKR